MSQAVEVLVPDEASATKVEQQIGRIASVQLRRGPSARSARRVAVASLTALENSASRERLASWLTETIGQRRDVPAVFLGVVAHEVMHFAAAAALAHLSSWVVANTKRELFLAPNTAALRRIILARKAGAEDRLIASASIEDGKLIVWSCEPKRYEVAVSEIGPLAAMRRGALANLVVSESGSRIHWDDGDVDLDLDAIRELGDPKIRAASEAKLRREAARMGDAIRRLREARGLRQGDIPGLSDRQVRRLEQGGMIPHSDSLRRLAAAHGMTANDYLTELAQVRRPRETTRRRRSSSK